MPKSCVISTFLKLTVLFLAVVALAQANLVGFTGPYDPSQWTLSNNPVSVGGSVDTSGAPSSVALTGGNSNVAGYTTWTIAAPAPGTVSFNWSYEAHDIAGPYYDPAGWILNGGPTQVTANYGPNSQSGSTSFSVIAGDTFGFYVYTLDGGFGPGIITPSNFSAPDSVPEPATLLLVGGPLILAGLRRRRA